MAKATMLGSKFAVPCRILKLTVGFIFNESNGLDKTLRINKRKKRQSLQSVTSPLLSRG